MKAPLLLGRLIFGGFFLYNGINHLKQRKALAQYAQSKNVPNAEVGVVATGAALILGGTSILLGIKPKLGAAAVSGFLLGVSPVIHNFWKIEDPAQRANEMAHFSKNMALLGGALALMGIEKQGRTRIPSSRKEAYRRRYDDELAA